MAASVFAPRAFAQPAPDPAPDATGDAQAAPAKDPKLAKRWLAAGRELIGRGDAAAHGGKADDAKTQYTNAVTAFTNAIATGDDPSVRYDLALAYDKLGQPADAYKQLKQLVAAQGVNAAAIKKAQAKLDDVSNRVGLVTLKITPDGAQISIAGAVVGESPLTEPLVLAPGTYALSLSAAGYQPKDAELKVEAGGESQKKLALEPVPVAASKPATDEPVEHASAPATEQPSKVPLIIGLAATGAFVATATITGVAAITQHHAFTDAEYSPAQRSHAQKIGRLEAHLTDAFIGGAVAGAAFTTCWYLFKYRHAGAHEAAPPAQAKIDVVPWVQPEASGLAVAGAF